MNQAILFVDDFYKNNRIFDVNDPISNRDDCLYHFWLLKEKFRERGIDLVTQDKCIEKPVFAIYNDMPEEMCLNTNYPIGIDDNYLIIWESEVIKPYNWIPKIHKKYFKKVFSWYPLWRDPMYIKMHWPVKKSPMMEREKTEFLCIIHGNKASYHHKELYSERQKAVDYFGDRIHVYGHGFNPIPNKLEVLSKYKFAICYENAIDIPGYVTEKLLDCMQAGTVPIYLGNNGHHVSQAYIDKAFLTYPQLDDYITNMNDDTYRRYQRSMKTYLEKTPHDAEVWAENIISNIL